jgi:ribosome-associated protein
MKKSPRSITAAGLRTKSWRWFAHRERNMAEFEIIGEYIELDKLLKAARLCGTGGEARIVISEGLVTIDGEPELRLRRKVRPGMTVQYNDETLNVR